MTPFLILLTSLKSSQWGWKCGHSFSSPPFTITSFLMDPGSWKRLCCISKTRQTFVGWVGGWVKYYIHVQLVAIKNDWQSNMLFTGFGDSWLVESQFFTTLVSNDWLQHGSGWLHNTYCQFRRSEQEYNDHWLAKGCRFPDRTLYLFILLFFFLDLVQVPEQDLLATTPSF